MANRYSRREFLEQSSLAGLAAAALGSEAAASKVMPTRVLGKTGARVSILALGCGSRLLMYRTPDNILPICLATSRTLCDLRRWLL